MRPDNDLIGFPTGYETPPQEASVCVTRHPALVEYLRENHLITPECRVISHATIDDIRGRVVAGILPLSLARFARAVIDVPLDITPEMRGRELTLVEVRGIAGPPRRYRVTSEPQCPDCGAFGCDGCE